MALRDIIGQERAINILRGCIVKDRTPHALLFTGDEGIGKRLTAVNFAKALNCLRNTSHELQGMSGLPPLYSEPRVPDSHTLTPADACDECPSCMKIEKGNHPDVSNISPEGEGGQITVSAIRQLEESLSYKPFEGRWKVAIVDNADRLNQSAANAFLQTLEEPSAQSILILVSSRPDMLLPTIRSRCQRISFSPLPTDTMSSLLRTKFGQIDDDQACLLSMLSGGRLGYALNDDLINQRDWSFNIFRQMLDNVEEDTWEDKEAMESWFGWSELLLRDIAAYKATGQTELLINQDKTDEIRAISQRARLPDVLKLARDLYNIKRKLIFNLNKQLTFNHISLLLRKNFERNRRQ